MQNSPETSKAFFESLCEEYQKHNYIDPEYYTRWGVKRGLRNADGTGVLAGVTQIGNVLGSSTALSARGASALKRRPICSSLEPCPPGRSWRSLRPSSRRITPCPRCLPRT